MMIYVRIHNIKHSDTILYIYKLSVRSGLAVILVYNAISNAAGGMFSNCTMDLFSVLYAFFLVCPGSWLLHPMSVHILV